MGALVCCVFIRAHCATSDAQEPRFSGHHLAKHHQIWFALLICSGFGFVCYLTLLLHWLSLYSTAVVESGGHHALDCLMRHNLCIVALWDPEAMLPWARYLLSKLISRPPFYFNIPRVSPVLYIITDALHRRSFSFLFLLSLLN